MSGLSHPLGDDTSAVDLDRLARLVNMEDDLAGRFRTPDRASQGG
jgi:hypothetical protein